MAASVSLSVVVPVFNEEEGIFEFLRELRKTLDGVNTDYEVIIVDDGSTDKTAQICHSVDWMELRVIKLTKNFGHQSAIMAGLDNSLGTLIITMDGDGQHPIDLIPQMLHQQSVGNFKVIYAQRLVRGDEKFRKRVPALLYYRLIRILTGIRVEDSQADFRLIHRAVFEQVKKTNGGQILRVLIPQLGYQSSRIPYNAGVRIAGVSKFQFNRQVSMAMTSILNYSSRPLRLLASVGAVVSSLALLWLIYVIAIFVNGTSVDGWASVMFAVLLIGGMILIALSIVGSYIAQIYDVVQGHPQYVIDLE